MSTKPKNDQDSIAQRRQAEENEQARKSDEAIVDKKLDGPNRPSV